MSISMKLKRMPRGGDITREELRNAIFGHLSVIMPDTFDDEDLAVFANVLVNATEDVINYRPRKKPESSVRKHAARERARRGGLPVLTSEAHFAIDGIIQLAEEFIQIMMDYPDKDAKSAGNDFLRLAKIARAWMEQQQEPGN